MKKEIIVCDRCGKENAFTFHAVIDRQCDPAGSMDDVLQTVDLCPAHFVAALQAVLNRRDYEWNKKFLTWAAGRGGL